MSKSRIASEARSLGINFTVHSTDTYVGLNYDTLSHSEQIEYQWFIFIELTLQQECARHIGEHTPVAVGNAPLIAVAREQFVNKFGHVSNGYISITIHVGTTSATAREQEVNKVGHVADS